MNWILQYSHSMIFRIIYNKSWKSRFSKIDIIILCGRIANMRIAHGKNTILSGERNHFGIGAKCAIQSNIIPNCLSHFSMAHHSNHSDWTGLSRQSWMNPFVSYHLPINSKSQFDKKWNWRKNENKKLNEWNRINAEDEKKKKKIAENRPCR